MQDVTPIQIRFQTDELTAIDAYRRTQSNPPSRPQAIRELLRNALSKHSGSIGPEAHA
jgi:hypothetical protein